MKVLTDSSLSLICFFSKTAKLGYVKIPYHGLILVYVYVYCISYIQPMTYPNSRRNETNSMIVITSEDLFEHVALAGAQQ